MAHQRDYYQILQISPNADPAIIKAAYYTQLKIFKKHPDLGGSHEEATLLNEAYEVLSDPAKRRDYDKKNKPSLTKTETNPFQPKEEQRRVPRIPFLQNFRLRQETTRNWKEAQFRDISLLGACLRTQESFKKGETLELEISQDPKIVTPAKVRWVRLLPQRFGKPLYEGGVEFEKIESNAFKHFLRGVGLEKLL